MNDSLQHLARDLDEFGFEQDYYGYVDTIDDREQARKDILEGLADKKYVEGIIDYLTKIIEEHNEEWETKAQVLINRVKVIHL